MADDKKVINYIRTEIKKGYALESIRSVLIEHGYPEEKVASFIESAQHPIADTAKEEHIIPAVVEEHQLPPQQSNAFQFLREDFIHLHMPSMEHALLVILPVAVGLFFIGVFLRGLHVELLDWALIHFAVYLVAGTFTAKAIARYLRKKGLSDDTQDAVFEKVMRIGFIIYLLSIAFNGRLLILFTVVGIGILAYAAMKKAHLKLWKSIEMITLFAGIGLSITYVCIFLGAVTIGLLQAKGLI